MNKNQLFQILAFIGFILIILGTSLYAINAQQRVFTYSSLAAGMLLLVLYIVMNMSIIKAFFLKRSSRHGANMIIMVILFTAVLGIIQTLSTRHTARLDLTRNSRFSLASQTTSLLDGLKKDVNIYGFYKKSSPDKRQAEDLIDQYVHKSSKVRYQFLDPDHNPQRAKDLGVTNYGTTVVSYQEKKELLSDLTEEKLTNAILKVTRDITKAIYFTRGHGEKDPLDTENAGYSIARESIEKEGYIVKTLSLFEEENMPDDAYIIVVAGPTKDFFASEIEKFEMYLNKGKNAIFLLDPQLSVPNLEALVSGYGISFENDVIIDPFSRIFGGNYTIPVVTQYESHAITKGFNVATFFPLSRSVKVAEDASTDIQAQYLARTGKSAWGETNLADVSQGRASRDEGDVDAPVPLVAISSRKIKNDKEPGEQAAKESESKIIAIGDSDFISNSSFRISGNSDFFMNMINFLAEEKDLISIRPKQSLGDRIFLTAKQGRLIFVLCVILLPLSVITFGTTLFVRRRRRG